MGCGMIILSFVQCVGMYAPTLKCLWNHRALQSCRKLLKGCLVVKLVLETWQFSKRTCEA